MPQDKDTLTITDNRTGQNYTLPVENGTIRAMELDQVQKLELEDPQLQKELSEALLALSQARDQDKKPVTINFTAYGPARAPARPLRPGIIRHHRPQGEPPFHPPRPPFR